MTTAVLQLVVVAGFAAVAVTVAALARIPLALALLRAAGRATLQLLAIGALWRWCRAGRARRRVHLLMCDRHGDFGGRVGVDGLRPSIGGAIAVPAAAAGRSPPRQRPRSPDRHSQQSLRAASSSAER